MILAVLVHSTKIIYSTILDNLTKAKLESNNVFPCVDAKNPNAKRYLCLARIRVWSGWRRRASSFKIYIARDFTRVNFQNIVQIFV